MPEPPEPPRTHVGGFSWSRRVQLGLPLAAVGAWCVGLLLWAQHGVDESLVRLVATQNASGPLVELSRTASRLGLPVIAAIHLLGLTISVWVPARRGDRKLYLLTLLSLAIAGVAGDLLKLPLQRPRPYVVFPELSFAAEVASSSAFPSGHSTKSLALVLPLLMLAPGWRGWRAAHKGVLALLALSVCASRIILGAHYLSDVVGGLAMALSALPLALLAANYILSQMKPQDLELAGRLWLGAYVLLIAILWMLS